MEREEKRNVLFVDVLPSFSSYYLGDMFFSFNVTKF